MAHRWLIVNHPEHWTVGGHWWVHVTLLKASSLDTNMLIYTQDIPWALIYVHNPIRPMQSWLWSIMHSIAQQNQVYYSLNHDKFDQVLPYLGGLLVSSFGTHMYSVVFVPPTSVGLRWTNLQHMDSLVERTNVATKAIQLSMIFYTMLWQLHVLHLNWNHQALIVRIR